MFRIIHRHTWPHEWDETISEAPNFRAAYKAAMDYIDEIAAEDTEDIVDPYPGAWTRLVLDSGDAIDIVEVTK